jgi:hypothetical protein
MRRSIVICISLLLVPLSSAYGISIALSVATSEPFSITVRRDSVNSTDLVLTVSNETNSTVTVLGWQLGLQLHPRTGAQGSLLFQSVMTAPESLFGPDPGPTSNLSEPSSHLIATDFDMATLTGQPVHPEMPRNILKLNLSADANTNGFFELVMPEFNPANPDVGTFWLEPDGTSPRPIANSTPSELSGHILLGTIQVVPAGPPILGDYNMNGVVDATDYHRWRAEFGSTPTSAGGAADGNGNSVIDAADYVVWRNAMESAGAGPGSQADAVVPEPQTCVGVILGICLYRFTNRPCHRAAQRFGAVVSRGDVSANGRNSFCIAAE